LKIVSSEYKHSIQEKSSQVVDEIFQITFGHNREIITKVKTKEFKSSLFSIKGLKEVKV